MAKTEQINVRIESDIKAAAEAVFQDLGISPSQAIQMFYRQVSLHKGLPFDVCIPNAETIAAMRESEHDKQALPRYKRFGDYLHSIGL